MIEQKEKTDFLLLIQDKHLTPLISRVISLRHELMVKRQQVELKGDGDGVFAECLSVVSEKLKQISEMVQGTIALINGLTPS